MPLSLLEDPEFIPYRLDLPGQRLLMLRMSAAERSAAAFLDERGMPASPQGAWMPLQAFLSGSDVEATARLDWIFHIGHCGSTLLSRLFEAWPHNQVLREPLPLRTVAGLAVQADTRALADRLLRRLLPFWGRPLPPHSRTIVKATSSCNDLISKVLEAGDDSRVLLLDMPLRPYLATLLKSQASIRDTTGTAAARWRVLKLASGAADLDLASLDAAELCAMCWLAEQARFGAWAGGTARARVLRVDFEGMLSAPEARLAAIADFLDLPAGGVATAMRSDWWQRYSKAGEHAYDAGDRDHDLALAQERFADQIERGLGWVERFVRDYPAVAPMRGP